MLSLTMSHKLTRSLSGPDQIPRNGDGLEKIKIDARHVNGDVK